MLLAWALISAGEQQGMVPVVTPASPVPNTYGWNASTLARLRNQIRSKAVPEAQAPALKALQKSAEEARSLPDDDFFQSGTGVCDSTYWSWVSRLLFLVTLEYNNRPILSSLAGSQHLLTLQQRSTPKIMLSAHSRIGGKM